MIKVNDRISIGEHEIVETFVRSRGPGGQNVNKVSSAVQLRFLARNSPSLSPEIVARLKILAGSRFTREGEIVITADRYRTQSANRKDALARLVKMIDEASSPVPRRIPTRPTRASKHRRLAAKSQRSQVKRLRSGKIDPSD